MKSIIGERGQVVIPKPIRDKLRLEKGVIMEIEADDDRIVLKPVRRKKKSWEEWIGVFEGEGLGEEYIKEKRSEKIREEKWIK